MSESTGVEDFNVFGGPYPAKADEFVVSLRYLPLISAKFDQLGLDRPWIKRRSDKLNLALLQLGDPGAVADTVMRAAADLPAGPEPRRPAPGNRRPLDQTLWGLRQLFSFEWDGWSPPIGKNRYLGTVHGVGEVQHVGGGMPLQLANRLKPPRRASAPGTDVRVGVLDGGFYPHSWLTGGYSAEAWDFLTDQPVPSMIEGHATFVSGLILSQAPGAHLELRQILDSTGQAESWAVAEAMVDLGRSGVDVLNLSFACYTEDGEPPLVLAAAMDRLNPDVAVIAAAGNHGDAVTAPPALDKAAPGKRTSKAARDTTAELPKNQDPRQNIKPAWPAALDNVIAVGAAERLEDGTIARAGFSPNAPWVDLYTAGVKVKSTYLPAALDAAGKRETFETWAEWSGTSFAAALISGAVAAATVPGRFTAAAAARMLINRLADGPSHSVQDATARYVPLRLLT